MLVTFKFEVNTTEDEQKLISAVKDMNGGDCGKDVHTNLERALQSARLLKIATSWRTKR